MELVNRNETLPRTKAATKNLAETATEGILGASASASAREVVLGG